MEVSMAARIAREAGVAHEIEQLGARGIGIGAALERDGEGIVTAQDAVVPCRNLALLTVAAAWASKLEAEDIVAGFSMADARDFPDCRPAFVRAASSAISLSLDRKVTIRAPLIRVSKVDSLKMADGLGCWDVLSKTWTCYTPQRVAVRTGHVRPCGECPACVTRAKAFADYGKPDPAAGREVRA
jgi:7-cyano-7-deazaguanine synthase